MAFERRKSRRRLARWLVEVVDAVVVDDKASVAKSVKSSLDRSNDRLAEYMYD